MKLELLEEMVNRQNKELEQYVPNPEDRIVIRTEFIKVLWVLSSIDSNVRKLLIKFLIESDEMVEKILSHDS